MHPVYLKIYHVATMSSESVNKSSRMKEPVDSGVAKVEEGQNFAAIDRRSERSYGKPLSI